MTFSIRQTAVLSLAILLGLFNSSLVVATPPPAALKDEVALTAWLDAEGGNPGDIIVEVNVNGTKDWGRPAEDGRVELMLPADAVALISFRKAGHRTKTVMVDTHNMQEGNHKGKHRNITFGLVLDAVPDNETLVYAGPVATIAFDATGTMAVQKDEQLVPERLQKVVF